MLTSSSLFGRRTGSFSVLPLWGWRTSTSAFHSATPWPREIVYLGLCLDSAAMTAMLSPPRRDAILLALSRFRVLRNVTALSTMRLLGPMAAAHPVVPLVCSLCTDSSGGLLANGWTPCNASSGCSSYPVQCHQAWNIGETPLPFSGVFHWAE
jgi:hypothetical protein